jgi:RNA polymerase sigma-70 factor (ECF subfamily)
MPARLKLVEGSPAPAMVPSDAYQAYAGYVAALAFRLLGREAEVDDVVQDVFLIALDGLGHLRHAAATKAWLGTLTVRTVGRRLRVRKFTSLIGFHDDDGEECFASTAASPEQRALLGEVYRVLEQLPVADRLAWTLRHVEGEPLDEVATLCRCSLATAKRRIAAAQRALEVLRVDP